MARNNLSPIMSLFAPCVIANRLQIIIEALSVFLSDFMDFISNNPPAQPGAFECEPLKAAKRGR